MPEHCQWIIPENDGAIIDRKDDDMVELIFDRIGDFVIGLKSIVGECEETLYKTVTVVPEGLGASEPLCSDNIISDIKVWPNPNDGNFKVSVSLEKINDGLLRLYSINGTLVREFKCVGSDSYEFSISEQLAVGIYILHVIFETERSTVKISVK